MNGHPNPSLAHGLSDAQGFQRTSFNAITPYRKPTWNNAKEGGSGRACVNQLARDS